MVPSPPPPAERPATIDGRAATFVVEGDQVVCVEVEMCGFDDMIPDTAIREGIAAAGLRCGVSAHVAWVEGAAGDDGAWRGVARFYPLGWRPTDPPPLQRISRVTPDPSRESGVRPRVGSR